jgi:hypothetical protein
MNQVFFQEKPDFIRYEDEKQILVVVPSQWIIIRKDKETNEKELIDRRRSLEEAKQVLQRIIDEKKEE